MYNNIFTTLCRDVDLKNVAKSKVSMHINNVDLVVVNETITENKNLSQYIAFKHLLCSRVAPDRLCEKTDQ